MDFDVVVVGGGIAGGAAATVLARGGLDVLVLERSVEYRDVVRGEWIAPWGVVEARRTRLYDAIVEAGGHHLSHHVTWPESPSGAEVIPSELPMLPDIPGPLCLGHPRTCDLFVRTAADAGATVLRGVSSTSVTPGPAPQVAYRHDGRDHLVRTRLVLGADGRGSLTRGQIGVPLHRDEVHHAFTGLLVDGLDWWPDNTEAIATEGDVHVLLFPQGGGRGRLYVGYPTEQRSRFRGAGGPAEVLRAFDLKCWPDGHRFLDARVAGPSISYPNADTWTDEPYVEGVVLIGDAAGYNDPIIGQGLSITLRDVRIVTETLLAGEDWSPSSFASYRDERAERMRRLRFAASLHSSVSADFTPEGPARRRLAAERMREDPTLMMCLGSVYFGPENIPPAAFDPSIPARLLAVD